MPHGSVIRTYFEGAWHEGNVPLLKAADHATWNGTLVFDGARLFDGVIPDLELHCARLNRSAEAMTITPTHTAEEIAGLIRDGVKAFAAGAAVYIRPMYWSIECGPGFITVDPESTGFAIGLEQIPMPDDRVSATLTTTRYCRPMRSMAPVEAKAACLYAHNQRMMREAIAKGFTNALVADPLGNVAETATSNVFMVKDGEVFTPVPNGTFLNGITRQRHIRLLRGDGVVVHEATLSFDDFRRADEVFLSGNLAKVTPVTAFDDVHYQVGPITRCTRALYRDWAHSQTA
jgi:branched-chain amino acid aminotransferase